MVRSNYCIQSKCFYPREVDKNNVVVGFECIHYIQNKRKGKNGDIALKLDMSIVYNRVDWEFLQRVTRKMGFEENGLAALYGEL